MSMNLLERGRVELQSGKEIPMQWVKPSYLLIAIVYGILPIAQSRWVQVGEEIEARIEL